MSISELWDSQECADTSAGQTVTRRFKCTWTEFNDREGYTDTGDYFYFPIIGDAHPSTSRLEVSDIRTRAVDNNYCIVEVFYTTNTKDREAIPDQITSWDESYQVQHTEVEIQQNQYYNKYNAGTWTPTKWTQVYPLIVYAPKILFTVTCYGSNIYSGRINDITFAVNSDLFISRYFLKREGVNSVAHTRQEQLRRELFIYETGFTSDTGYWLCMEANMARENRGCLRYNLQFAYNIYGKWNDWPTASTNAYKTYDFMNFFSGMDKTDYFYNDMPRQ